VGDVLQLRDEHEQAQMLLPWFANGTLDASEAAMVEAHLAQCEACSEELAECIAMRELYAAMPVGGTSQRSAPLRAGNVTPIRGLRRGLSSRWGRAATAAVAAAAALTLIVVVTPSERGDGEYRLLGSNSGDRSGNAIVLFSPDTAERDLRAALEGADAKVVDGPTASGAYIVRVPAETRADALEQLRGLPQVVLAEPVDAAGGP